MLVWCTSRSRVLLCIVYFERQELKGVAVPCSNMCHHISQFYSSPSAFMELTSLPHRSLLRFLPAKQTQPFVGCLSLPRATRHLAFSKSIALHPVVMFLQLSILLFDYIRKSRAKLKFCNVATFSLGLK